MTTSRQEKLESSYAAVLIPGEDGKHGRVKYVYYAPWYVWELSPEERRREKGAMLALELVSLALMLDLAATAGRESNELFFSLPWTLALCAQIWELTAVARFLAAKERSTVAAFEGVNGVMSAWPAYRAVLCAVCGAAAAVCGGMSPGAVIRFAGFEACAGMALAVFVRYRRIRIRMERNTALDELGELLDGRLEGKGMYSDDQ